MRKPLGLSWAHCIITSGKPNGNLRALNCGVCLNPKKGGYEQIGLVGEAVVVMNSARSSPQGTKGA